MSLGQQALGLPSSTIDVGRVVTVFRLLSPRRPSRAGHFLLRFPSGAGPHAENESAAVIRVRHHRPMLRPLTDLKPENDIDERRIHNSNLERTIGKLY